ncbi:cation transporter [bacterium]|nr:cation transporter [bacterium]
MEINKKKKFAAGLSIVSNIILSLLKIGAGILSGSLSIISEAIHSMSDLLASFITFFSVMKSSQPADKDHPFGHGKYEDMSGFIEGLLIIFASFYIIYEAARKIVHSVPIEIESNIGISVMLFAVIMNIIVSECLFKTAKESNSISLYADAEHLRTDVYSSFGVMLGLILIKITGHTILDPIIAILTAVFIYRAGYTISKKAFLNLLDHSLPESDLEKIRMIVRSYPDSVVLKENGIRARQVGPIDDIDLVLQFPEDTSICECHKICEGIEKEIREIFVNASISIHSEPACYSDDCQNICDKKCNLKNNQMV